MTKTEKQIRFVTENFGHFHINNTVDARIALRLCNTDQFTIMRTPIGWAMQSYIVVSDNMRDEYQDKAYRLVSNEKVRREWFVI